VVRDSQFDLRDEKRFQNGDNRCGARAGNSLHPAESWTQIPRFSKWERARAKAIRERGDASGAKCGGG
jgi:hypothetical protein